MLGNRLRWIHWGLIPLQLTLCAAVVLYLCYGQPIAYWLVLPHVFGVAVVWSSNHLWQSQEIDSDYRDVEAGSYLRHVRNLTLAWIAFLFAFALAMVVTTIAIRSWNNFLRLSDWQFLAAFGFSLDVYRNALRSLSKQRT